MLSKYFPDALSSQPADIICSPQNKAFGDSVTKLFNDLGHDEDGKTTFKPHLVKDLTEVILPAFFENVRYVPIPRIEYSDPMVDAVIENLVIEGDNLAPNVMELGSDNYWRWGRKSITSKNKNKVMLSVSGVQMDLRDVSYYIKKKQGFPSITDKGVMDIFMGGSGFSFKVEMENADVDDKIHYFKINKVTSDIQNLQIKVKQSNHKVCTPAPSSMVTTDIAQLLFNMFKPLLLKVMRPIIQRVLEKQIKDNVNQLDAMIYDIKKEADKAAADAKRNPDPENLQNIYQRYASAANQRIMQGKQKKAELEKRAKETHVNMAVTQHDSMFKNITLPGGISTKATEYKELASKGDKWESPVFSLGSAKETSSLPKIAAVTRKPHGRTGGYGGQPGVGQSGLGQSGLGQSGLGQPGLGQSGLGGVLPGAEYGRNTGAGQGLASQMDGAFNAQSGGVAGAPSSGIASGVPGGALNPAAPGGVVGTGQQGQQFNTTLGANNPVFQGQA